MTQKIAKSSPDLPAGCVTDIFGIFLPRLSGEEAIKNLIIDTARYRGDTGHKQRIASAVNKSNEIRTNAKRRPFRWQMQQNRRSVRFRAIVVIQ